MAKRTPKRTSRKYRNRLQKTKKKILREKSRKSLRKHSKKSLRKQSRKSLRKHSKKSLRKQYKNNKNILFGGMMGLYDSPGGGGDGGGGGPGGAAAAAQKFQYYKDLLLHDAWYPIDRIDTFLDKFLNFDGASPIEILEKKKK